MQALRPPRRIALSHFIESEIRLPDDVSALPGSVRLYPFQAGIADAISDPELERVTIQKSARIGYTTLLVGALAHFVANDPAQILAVLPIEKDCRNFVVANVEPIFRSSPSLAGKLSEGDRNTILSRRYAGGSLNVVAAKSPNNLRGHNTRVLIMDEVDSMEITAEGSPILLAEGRTSSFPDRKIIIGSTPVDAATSLICESYDRSDKRIFEVCCPHCVGFAEVLWEHLRWPDGKPELAAWFCPECGAEVPESYKTQMVAAGRWRATQPEVVGHAGFRINSLVSPLHNARWPVLAAEFLEKKGDPDKLRTFKNLVLGLPWIETLHDIDEAEVAGRGEPFGIGNIPAEVLYLTMGVDVQDDRLEACTLGHDRDDGILILDHAIIFGSPDDDQTWRELDALITARHAHPLGGTIGIDATAVDSGDGDWTQAVYDFCNPRSRRRVMAIKGMAGSRPVLAAGSKGKTFRNLFIVASDVVKTTLMNRTARKIGIRFSKSLDQSWFEQFLSQVKVVRYVGKRPVSRWEQISGRRSECLDATVYAYAARQAVPSNFDARAGELRLEPTAEKRPTTIRSAWMQQGMAA